MSQTCDSCLQSKASLKNNFQCGLCQKRLCKDCAQFLDEDCFSFMKKVPQPLSHTIYCDPCFREHVAEAQSTYTDLIERAQKLPIFYKNERNIPLISKSNVKVIVENCEDRQEALWRLAFQAVEQKYNGLTGTEMISKKIIQNGYQKTHWSGSAFPSNLREDDVF